MTPLLFLLVALAGGLGAAVRFLVDGAVRARFGERLPWGTIAINLSGSLLLGLVSGLTLDAAPAWAAVVGAGLLGGYTTFSAASVESVRLLQQRRLAASFATGIGQLAVAVALASVGVGIGALVAG